MFDRFGTNRYAAHNLASTAAAWDTQMIDSSAQSSSALRHLAARRDVRLDTSLEYLLHSAAPLAGPCALATVVATAGSTYRKPGARMLIMDDGRYLGLLSGGCLEADLLVHAREVMHSSQARAVEYDMRGPDDVLFGIGAGCEGAMRILLEPASPGSSAMEALRAAGRLVHGGTASALAVVHGGTELPLGTFHPESTGQSRLHALASEAITARRSISSNEPADSGTRIFSQYLAPTPHLLICGAGPDAQPVASAACSLGWRVSVVDHRPAYASGDRFPGAAVALASPRALRATLELQRVHACVVMSHHLQSDELYLRELAAAGEPQYVGLLGPEGRRHRLMQELDSMATLLDGRLHGPVGLDIGAVTPEAIALAIVAQVHGWLAGRGG